MSNWVTTWLDGLGLGQYASAFSENALDRQILPELTDSDLKELGVKALGHRKVLLREISALPVPVSPSPQPAMGKPHPMRRKTNQASRPGSATRVIAGL